MYIHTYIPNTLPKQKQTIITLTYSLILLHHLLPTYSYIILSTLKDSNPQSPNPKLGAFTNLAKDATYYSTIHKKKNSTMSHWKKSLFTFLFKLKIDSCKQWDLNPHSFTLLFPKNSLSTNFNMLTLLYTKNPLP